MKKYFFLLLVAFGTPAFAQFKLLGTIKNYSGHTELKVNIPQVYGFDEANSIIIPVSKSGSFSIRLPLKSQKFADLIFQQNFHLMLLNPGKSLTVSLNEADKGFRPTAGSGLPENTVLLAANVEEYPFFLQNDPAYTSLSLPALNEKLIKPYFTVRDKKIAAVNQSSISQKDKKLIASEIKYAAYNNLYELVLLGGQYQTKMEQLVMDAYSKADPKPDATPPGPQYYRFACNYMWYKQAKALAQIKAQHLKPNQLIPGYGITVAQAQVLTDKYGNSYTRWLGATKFLPVAVTEQVGYLFISIAFKNHNVLLTNILAQEYDKKFPNGMYKKAIQTKLAQLK